MTKQLNDEELKFNEKKHQYSYKGQKLISVTTLIGHFFEPFDRIGIARKLAKIPSYKERGMGVRKILAEWDRIAAEGTYIHKQLEDALTMGSTTNIAHPKTLAGLSWLNKKVEQDHYEQMVHPEVQIYDEEYGIAGTVDCLCNYNSTDDGQGYRKAFIADWKTNKKIHTTGFNGKKSHHYITSELDDCNFSKYFLQLNVYCHLLRKNYGVRVEEMYLVHLTEEGAHEYIIPYVPELAEAVCATAKIINKCHDKRKRWYKMLSNEQKEELKKIVAYPASFGAFTGMIFNQLQAIELSGKVTNDETIEYLIRDALDIKLKVKELVQ